MKKSEMFEDLAQKVCEVCEIRRENLLRGCRVQAVVDARMLCVQYLRRLGLSFDDIALISIRKSVGDDTHIPDMSYIRQKARGVRKQFDGYSQRCIESRLFCLMSQEIGEYCKERYGDSYLSWLKPEEGNKI